MVWVIELSSVEFYDKDRAFAFKDLNEKKIWHHFIEKFEEKRNLSAEIIVDEIGKMLSKEKKSPGLTTYINDKDTETIIAAIKIMARKYNWNYSVCLDRFYNCRAMRTLCHTKLSPSAFSPEEILDIFERECDHSPPAV